MDYQISKDGRFVLPRRFSECWQMSQDWPGSIEQQVSLREAYHLTHGENKWGLFKQMDKAINDRQRSAIIVSILPQAALNTPWTLAQAYDTGILMSELVAPGEGLMRLMMHEAGHCYDGLILDQGIRNWYMTESSGTGHSGDWRQYVEPFADSWRDMILGTGWQHMWPVLL